MDDLYKIIAEIFKIKPGNINDNLGPNDIEAWDSLGQLRLISALETHYRVTFDIAEIFEIFTIGDIKRLLAKKGIQ